MARHEFEAFRVVSRPGDDPSIASTLEMHRLEVILKAVFEQWARAAGGKPIRVEMTYDPVSTPEQPISGLLFTRPRG